MRYNHLKRDLFIENRRRLYSSLNEGTIVLLFGNRQVISNADANYNFIQNSDFYYYTGIDQEDSVFLSKVGEDISQSEEYLFVKKTNDFIKVWEGEKLSINSAKSLSGIAQVKWIEEFDFYFNLIMERGQDSVFINLPNKKNKYDSVNLKYIEIIDNYPELKFSNIKVHSTQQRLIKAPDELNAIKKAIDITDEAFRYVLSENYLDKPEYHIEADIHSVYTKRGSLRPAFHTIVAGGENANILHYIENNKILNDGEMVLVDTGAEYANYNADITRVLPVNGKFSTRQAEVYSAVLTVLNDSINEVRAGITLLEFNNFIADSVFQQLVKLNLLESNEKSRLREYYMHSGAHFLGLDVHDVGSRKAILQPGMVITVEPGIYISEEKLGIRLENDVLITSSGCENLSENIPLEIEYIEKLMKG